MNEKLSSKPSTGNSRGAVPRWFSLTPDEMGAMARRTFAPAHPADNRVIVLRGILVTEPKAYARRYPKLMWSDVLTLPFLTMAIRRVLSWGGSAIVHVLALLILAAIVTSIPHEDDRILTVTMSVTLPVSNDPSTEKPKGPESTKPVVTDTPKEVLKPLDQVPVKTLDLPPTPSFTDLKVPVVLGAGGGNVSLGDRPTVGNPYASRGGGGDGTGGPPRETEEAVARGLKWLGAHQSRSGAWDPDQFWNLCPVQDRCVGSLEYSGRGSRIHTPGLTGLATLAFLGAGHTHMKAGDYQETVRRALGYIESIQQASGVYCPADISDVMYNHAVCTLAVAEAYGMSRDARLKPMLKKAVKYIIDTQQLGGGWDYRYTDPKDGQVSNRNDVSITGWIVMALKAARLADIEVPPKTLIRIADFIERRTEPGGEVAYSDKGTGAGRKGLGMVAVGILCRLYLDMKRETPILEGVSRMMKNVPDWDKMSAQPPYPYNTDYNMYYWYYGTLVLHFLEGSQWERWNLAMQKALLPHQNREGHRAGSWDPERNHMGGEGGRIYSTAINVLTLEVYYRYANTYVTSKDDPSVNYRRRRHSLILQPESGEPQDVRRQVIMELKEEMARNPSDREAVQLVASMLKNPDDELRRVAFNSLAEARAASALPVMMDAVKKETAFKRAFLEALGEFRDASTLPLMAEALDDPDPNLREGAMAALRKITGKNLAGVEMWKEWLRQQQKK